MNNYVRPAVILLGLITILTGVVYPVVVTVAAQVAFPYQANGSVMVQDGQAVGSNLIGQNFDQPRYFWGRLSATGGVAYNGAASSGSNYGPTHPALTETAEARVAALQAADPTNPVPIPVELVTASASGLDPHISPAAAAYQVARVARERGLDQATVRELVAQHTEERTFGILGEPRVNVLALNLALDGLE